MERTEIVKPFASFLFEHNAPWDDKIAIIDQNGARKTSWADLYERACHVAVYARRKGLRGLVPVYMERGAEAVSVLLGLSLAGIGVAPLADSTPEARVQTISEQCQNPPMTMEDYALAMREDISDFAPAENGNMPAYVVYTSGSTGVPKGVMLDDNSMIHSILRNSQNNVFAYCREDIALQTASFAFIALAFDLFAPLYCGCVVHILPDVARKDINLMTAYIRQHGITTMIAQPQLLRQFQGAPSLRLICTGSEKVSNVQPKGYALVNGYGMSETAMMASYYSVQEAAENTPIGKPNEDFCFYILDENGNPAEEGELCISGAIATGYFGRPDLTEAVFTPNPFPHAEGHERLLHTGDIARRLPDGNYLYVNRKDFMLKINGQRVEPGEAEAALQRIEGIHNAVAKGFVEENGRSYLCAYYTADSEIPEDFLRDALKKTLPSYMIPSFFVHLDALPLNANGKLNRAALLAPDAAKLQNAYEPARNEAEAKLCHAFETVLKLNRVGATDDFFRLGGDSIRAMAVVQAADIEGLSAANIFSGRTPRGIAALISVKESIVYANLPKNLTRVPLTDSQMGIYLECIAQPESTMYNIPAHFSLVHTPELTAEAVRNVVQTVLSMHPALFAHIETDGESVLMVRNAVSDVCAIREADEFSYVIRPFDLRSSPLCRAEITLTKDTIHILLDMHHIIADGSSVALLGRQILTQLAQKPVPQETVDAFALSEAESRVRANAAYAEDKKYFDSLVGGVETDSNLLFDRRGETYTSAIARYALDGKSIAKFLQGTPWTESTFFMGVFAYVLAKMTGQSESLFCAAERGRKYADLENTVSMLVRTLPVVVPIDETKPVSALLDAVQAQFFRSMEHDAYSFGEIAREYGIKSDVMFVYQGELIAGMDAFGRHIDLEMLPTGMAFANIALSMHKCGMEYRLMVEYRTDRYLPETIDRFADMFRSVADAFTKDMPLYAIPLLSDSDKVFLDALNSDVLPYDASKTIVDMFRDAARTHPDKNAVVFRDTQYTYAQIDALTDALAAHIQSLGIQRGDVVSVLIPRNEYMVIASIGVMKASAIYQPLDPSYPAERLSFMRKDADSKLLIADRSLISILPELDGQALFTDDIPRLAAARPSDSPQPEDGYILLYTSGTTGTPKGCMLAHSNMAAFIHARTKIADIDENARMTTYASYGFDAHMFEIYPCLCNAATLYIVPEEIRLDFPTLKEYYESVGITHTFMTTQVARQFATEYPEIRGLRYLCCGGEKLVSFTPSGQYRIVNYYGPTESTIAVTYFHVDRLYDDIPIGKPFPNMRLFVVDSFGRRLPVGVPGELIVCGVQVAKGYINREEQTKKVFVPNTFEENPSIAYSRCYKTGDIVRYIHDGNIEFIGRRDMQVKIRGFRIELSEVERVIREYPDISDATVVARDDVSGKCIHAYIVSNKTIDIAELNAFIRERKPAYMVPAATMQIERIPLTPNMKVDKRKLPAIVRTTSVSNGKRSMTALEEKLVAIVREIVGHAQFDVQTNFSEAGITSISSIKLAVRIFKEFGVHVSSKDVLESDILSMENRIVSELIHAAVAPTEKPRQKLSGYPLTQTQMGIYLDSMRSGSDAYNIPMLAKLPKDIDIDRLKKAIVMAIHAHPSMLCYIHPDKNGDVAVYPQEDMPIEIAEETIETLPPQSTHFEFAEAPLFRFRILRHAGNVYLMAETHHSISDGESVTILLDDIDHAYRGEELAEESYTAGNLSLDEQAARSGSALSQAKEYYDSVFRGVSSDYLPDGDRKGDSTCRAMRHALHVSSEAVSAYCKQAHVSENIFFTGVFALTLARYTAHEDALFATIHNGRTDPRTERLVSMLVKTLPVYADASAEKSVQKFLQELDQRVKALKKYDIFSFADAAQTYGVHADVIFIYQGRMLSSARLDGRALEIIPVDTDAAKAQLSMELYADADSYYLNIEYNGGRYSAAWMDSFAAAYAACAQSMLSRNLLGEIEILSEAELEKFSAFNDTDYPVRYRPAYAMLEECVDAHPERTAVIARNGKLTYHQLDCMANKLARWIQARNIPIGSAVEIIVERTREIYIAEFGILKAGCAFLNMSPDYPDERIAFVSNDADVQAIVTTHAVAERRQAFLDSLGKPILYADDIDEHAEDARLRLDVAPDLPAYCIYTSGSTGKPKGVKLLQRNLVNLADANPKNFETIAYTDGISVASAVSTFTFDASIWEGFVPLVNGVTVCIATEDEVHDPIAFRKLCLENGVMGICSTPSFLLNMLDFPDFADVVRRLKVTLCGGEAYPVALYERLRAYNPALRIVNGYGPTEATVTCSGKILTSSESITVGTPNANTKMYIVDKQNHILPMGALGELVVTGAGVGAGYIHRDDLTQKVFIRLLGQPAYKTGDLACVTHDGEIEFHGRIDNQVKLRGLRVELGEIETAINACPDVKTSIVTVHGDENNRFLAAYYTASRPISAEEITARISKTLTEYMIPRILVQLDEMPLTANGKIDKRALPEPQMAREKREYVAPTTETERVLCEGFAKVLGVEKVGVTDDFFSLGGTSLTATKVAMFAITRNISIVYADIFKHPTVRELAALSQESEAQENNRPEEDYTDINGVLEGNVWHIGDDAGERPLGNILLTGATGFLGMHVLQEFLTHESGDVYCLLRKGAFADTETKLLGMYIYYFDTSIEEQTRRIHCIEGDITDDNIASKLADVPFDTLINCAACVKHFANSDILEKVNVHGVENLVKLCMNTHKRLIHVSTVSVAGESVNGQPDPEKKLHENELYFGQALENEYISTKFRSERVVLNAVAKGLDAKIMRAGNLMPRLSDGEFQINSVTNGFMRRLHGYYALGCAPYSALHTELEFSPIDETAAAMLCLAKSDTRFHVFHANNTHRVYMFDVIRVMNAVGLPVEIVSEQEFASRIKAAMEDTANNQAVGGLIAYLNRDFSRRMLDYDNAFTRSVLNRMGYGWQITDDAYLRNAFTQLRDMGFFDLDL